MSKLSIKGGVVAPFYQGLIEVDCDPDAETLLVFDKAVTKFAVSVAAVGVVKLIVPMRYGTSTDLIVGITDSDQTYAGKFVDGVKAQLIDGTVTNIMI